MPDPYDYECGSILGMKMLWDEHSAERRAVLVATDTLLSIVRNVCDHPNEAKFRRLKKTSNVYSLKIAPMPLAEDLLAFCGFEDQTEEDGSKVLRLPDAVVSESTERCQTAVSELQVFRAALQKSFPLSLVLGASLCRMGSGAGAALEAVNTLSGLLGSYVGVYFSASWCPPCRQFTPLLASTYQSIRAAGKAFEVVFVSLDRDQASYEEYFKHQADIGGTWLSVPWASLSAGLKDALSTQYGVRGIPHFVVLSPDGQLICKEGRNAVMQDPSGLMFPWAV